MSDSPHGPDHLPPRRAVLGMLALLFGDQPGLDDKGRQSGRGRPSKPTRKPRPRHVLKFERPEPEPPTPHSWLTFAVPAAWEEQRVKVSYYDADVADRVRPKPNQVPCGKPGGGLWLIEQVAPRPRLATM